MVAAAEQQTEQQQVVVLTTLGCPHCRRAKAALADAGIAFRELDLSARLDVLAAVKQATGRRTVPQVFAGGRLLGGADETLQLLGSGELQALLSGSSGDGTSALPAELQDLLADAGSAAVAEEDLEALVRPPSLSRERFSALLSIAAAMRRAGLAGTHMAGLRRVQACFPAQQAADWLVSQRHAPSQPAARELLSQLAGAHLLGPAGGGGRLLRLLGSASEAGGALNASVAWQGPARPATEVAAAMRTLVLRLYERHLSSNGARVRYATLATDPGFALLLLAAAELQAADLTPLSREQRMAFFINTYNALIVHAQAVLGGPSGLLSKLRWFASVRYCIGGLAYSADDIEHGMLRCNRPAPSSPLALLGRPGWAGGHLKRGDPRLQQALPELDPRIHFALNCGAKSCPPIKVYTPETLEEGLQSATAAFCEGEVAVHPGERRVVLSKLFHWYRADFGGSKQQLLAWLLPHLPPQRAEALQGMLEAGADSIRLEFSAYDWDLNSG